MRREPRRWALTDEHVKFTSARDEVRRGRHFLDNRYLVPKFLIKVLHDAHCRILSKLIYMFVYVCVCVYVCSRVQSETVVQSLVCILV